MKLKKQTINNLLLSQLDFHNNKKAILFRDKKISYKQLEEKSDFIVDYLIKKGAQPKEVIGVVIEKSPEMIFSILAIHKIGACCFLLDPNDRTSNLKYFLRSNKVNILLCSRFEERFKEFQKVKPDAKGFFSKKITKPKINYLPEPEDPAFIFYTSGSTGKPKGVILSHDNIVNGAYSWICRARINSKDRLMLSMAITSLPIIFNIYIPLFVGGSLLIPEKNELNDFFSLFSTIEENGITIAEIPNQLIYSYVKYLDKKNKIKLRKLRIIVTGGEKIPKETIEGFLKEYSNIKFAIIYGCTEYSSITINFFDSEEKILKVTEGTPVINTEILILDGKKQLLPKGEVGSLYVSGASLSSGYVDQKESENYFLKHPLKKNITIFRTGDTAKINENNSLEILGREDDIVKIRSRKVNLAYLENVLKKIKDIKDTSVICRQDKHGNNFLVAYYTNDKESNKRSSKSIKKELHRKISSWMVPDYLVRLDRIPLTKNGKHNKKKLLEYAYKDPFFKKYVIDKRLSRTELKMLKIWREIFGKKTLISENFFELGGNSIKAIQIVSRINSIFNVKLSLVDIFQKDNVKKISKLIQKRKVN